MSNNEQYYILEENYRDNLKNLFLGGIKGSLKSAVFAQNFLVRHEQENPDISKLKNLIDDAVAYAESRPSVSTNSFWKNPREDSNFIRWRDGDTIVHVAWANNGGEININYIENTDTEQQIEYTAYFNEKNNKVLFSAKSFNHSAHVPHPGLIPGIFDGFLKNGHRFLAKARVLDKEAIVRAEMKSAIQYFADNAVATLNALGYEGKGFAHEANLRVYDIAEDTIGRRKLSLSWAQNGNDYHATFPVVGGYGELSAVISAGQGDSSFTRITEGRHPVSSNVYYNNTLEKIVFNKQDLVRKEHSHHGYIPEIDPIEIKQAGEFFRDITQDLTARQAPKP